MRVEIFAIVITIIVVGLLLGFGEWAEGKQTVVAASFASGFIIAGGLGILYFIQWLVGEPVWLLGTLFLGGGLIWLWCVAGLLSAILLYLKL